MANYRKTNSLAAVDAAYIAGIVDGEGTITLSRKHAGENRQLLISVSNTERPILDFVRETVGAGKITRKRTSKTHHAPGLTFCNLESASPWPAGADSAVLTFVQENAS